MKWKILTISVAMLFCQNVYSQSITWQRTYYKNVQAIGNDLCQTTDGNFVVAGTTLVENIGDGVFVMKINGLGDTLWTTIPIIVSWRSYEGLAVTSTPDGGVVIVGSGDSTFVVKINQLGVTEWLNFYPPYTTLSFDIIGSRDGGFIACGRTLSSGFIIKVNSTGGLLWQKIYPGNFRGFNAIDTALGDGYIITGESISGAPRLLILKINEMGDSVFQKTFLINNRGAVGVAVFNRGSNYLIAGSTTDVSNNEQMYIASTNEYGDTISTNALEVGTYSEYIASMKVISDNRYLLCYEKDTVGTTIGNAAAVIIDSNANIIRKKVFTNSYFFWGALREVVSAGNGDLLFAGTAKMILNNATVIYAVRTDSLLNTSSYIGINNISQTEPENFQLFQNYPNPFNPKTKIRFQISGSSIAQTFLSVYDITGKEISLLVNADLKPGSYEVSFDASGLSSGVYFYKISAGSFTDVKKMVHLK